MSMFILIEAQLAEQHWTAPEMAWRLKMCLAAAQVAGDAAGLERLRQDLQQKLDIVNACQAEPVSLRRLLCLALERAVKRGGRDGEVMALEYGALLALEMGLRPDGQTLESFQEVRRLTEEAERLAQEAEQAEQV